MAAKKRSKKRLNSWFYAALVSAAVPFIAFPITKFIEGDGDLSSYAALILFGAAAGFTGFGTTGAIKEGEFMKMFYTASRQDSPVSFWVCAIFGYVVAIGFVALIILGLTQNT